MAVLNICDLCGNSLLFSVLYKIKHPTIFESFLHTWILKRILKNIAKVAFFVPF